MKRFMLFAGSNQDPGGGFKDYCGSFDSMEEAKESQKESCPDWYQIFDRETNTLHEGYSNYKEILS